MKTTDVKSWKISTVEKAISEEHYGNTRIEVPKFQRNLVWKKSQKEDFIDSIKRGFPVGTLLFYKRKDAEETYSLIDGLQRSSTICDFIKYPTKYFSIDDIDDNTIENLHNIYKSKMDFEIFANNIRDDIKDCIQKSDLNSLELLSDIAETICENYSETQNVSIVRQTRKVLSPCIENFKKMYDSVAESEVPVLVFSGNEEDLPTVFERINDRGTTLGKYQIYAASWAVDNYIVKVENQKVIEHIVNKYDAFIEQGYALQGYENGDDILASKELSLFEYVLGLGKYLSDKYPLLFEKNKDAQEVNQVGFEILNACFGKHNKDIKTLNQELKKCDINLLERNLVSVIDDVSTILNPYISFKGNTRDDTNILFHSSNQMVSIVACTFREKYDINNLQSIKSSWNDSFEKLKITLPQHYIFDMFSHKWAEGAFGKIYSLLLENDYLNRIEKSQWEAKLDDWFSTVNSRREKNKVQNPKSIDKLFLNCVHLNKFTAYQQLSQEKFDIEHILPKDKLKKLIEQNKWEGLPISSIGNICYLPEYDNRSKGSNTIYEDSKYIQHLLDSGIELELIEKKYTLTKKEDLDWINRVYNNDDYQKFIDNYWGFLLKRFNKMKKEFYETLKVKK